MFPPRPSTPLRPLAALSRFLLAAAFVAALQVSAAAAGTFISAPNRVDMVYDSARDTLYITSGGSVLRYHVGSEAFLAPFALGGNLAGLDLSPDGDTLVVADKTRTPSEVWVHVVDLPTGQARRATFPREFGEGGTYTVAFGNDGAVLVAGFYEGSGWTPLRKYHPASGAFSKLATISDWTMVKASGDGSSVGFAEGNISDGRFGRHRVADGHLLKREWYEYGTGWFNYEIGVNRNATQYAIPTYGGTFIYNSDLLKTGTLGQYAGASPVGVAYHPVEDLVYFAWATTQEVRAHDTGTFAVTAAYNFEHTFQHPGNRAFDQGRLRLSRDGSLLFVTVAGGLRYLRLYAPLAAEDVSVTTEEDAPVAVALSGGVGNGAAVGHTVVSQPEHGTLSGEGASLVYTPDADYSGPDSFTYKATYGPAASAPNTVSITVNPSNDAPAALDHSFAVNEDGAASVALSGSDPDGDPLAFVVVSGPAHGTLSGAGASLTYTPHANYNGPDSFTFKVNDGALESNTATVSVTVARVNDAPVAFDLSASAAEDTATPITLSASDADGDRIGYSVTSGPAHGTLSGTGANLVYTPHANYYGPDSFAFRSSDGAAVSNLGTVSLTVTAVNDAPVAEPDAVTAARNTSVNIPVLANDHDVDGDAVRVSAVSNANSGGTVTIVGGGTGVVYRSRPTFTGVESFTYMISDGKGGTATTNVMINVVKK